MADAQAELRLPPHRLITETPTRWGSRQKMIQRVIEQEKAISQVLRAEKKTRHLVPSWQEMDVLESVSKTLGPLIEFTDALSEEEYVSVSYLKPVLHLLNNTVLTPAEDDTDLTKDMKKSILKYLNEKYSEAATDDLLDMASLLDPRFRATYSADDRKEYIKTKAAAEITSLLQRQANSTQEPQTREAAEEGAAVETAEAAAAPKKAKRSLGSFFKKAPIGPVAYSSRDAVEAELKSYLQAEEVDGETDPLEWWRLHKANFPRVACLARKYLCIPATSAPSERAFSTGGNIVTCHRSALKPVTVDRLVFLANNL